jgi:hypothetical protein
VKDLEGSGHGLIVQSWHLPVGTEEMHENLSIGGIPTEIQTEHLLNAGLGHYC